MTVDETVARLLEESAGPKPGWGDVADVRRRARRFTRRRRAGWAAGVVALLLPGAFAATRLQPGDGGRTMMAAAAGDVLFERRLAGGETLRVSGTGVEGHVLVEWPGSPEPVERTPTTSMDEGAEIGFMLLSPGDGSPYMELWPEVDDQGWELISVATCPGDPAAELRAWADGTSPEEGDAMALVDGLAMVAVPFTFDTSATGSLPDEGTGAVNDRAVPVRGGAIPVNFEVRDAAGAVLASSGAEAERPTSDGGVPADDGTFPPGLSCGAGQ